MPFPAESETTSAVWATQLSRITHDAVELLILKRPPPSPGHRFENNDCGGEIGVSRMNDWTRAGIFPSSSPYRRPRPPLRRLSSLYEATRSSSKSFHVRGELFNNILRGRRAIFFPSISHAANTPCVCARPSWPHTPAPAFLLYESVRRTDGDREISRCTYTGSSAGRKENAEKTVRLATRKKIAEKTGRERSKTSFYPLYI